MASRDELPEARRYASGELARTPRSDPLLEDRNASALLLLAVMDQELAQHADACCEGEVAGSRDEQALERIAKQGVFLERPLSRSVRTVRERIDQLLLREGVTDDFVGERPQQAALGRLLGLVEQIDDPAMLFFENVFER
jgi:hypothetical protein